MLALLARRPAFRRLWLGELVSLAGDWLSYVAVSVLALRSGHGALALSLVFAAHSLPAAAVSPVAGFFADRFDRRRLLVFVQLAQAALTLAMLAAAMTSSFAALQLALFARTAVSGAMFPARSAALARVVEEDELVDANALEAATWSVTFSLGTALGGVLTLLGPAVALALDALTFVFAAALFLGLPEMKPTGGAPPRARGATREALARVLSRPGLLEATFAKTPLALAAGAGWVLLNLRADAIGGAAGAGLALGLLQGARGVGTGVGPVFARALARRGAPHALLLRAAVLVGLVAIAGLARAHALAPMLALVFAWGVGGGASWVFSSSEVQRLAGEGFVGRASALDQLGFTTGMASSAALFGWAVDRGASPALAASVAVGVGALAYLGLLATSRGRHVKTSRAPAP